MKLAHKLALAQTLAIVILSLLTGLGIRYWVGSNLVASETQQLAEVTKLVVQLTDSYRQSLESSVASHMQVLEEGSAGAWTVNGTAPVGEKALPALYVNGRLQNQQFELVDRLTAMTGSVATLFVREGDDFWRVTTSLKKEDGTTRALGTQLDRKHPAYVLLLAGKPYTGKASLFGREYMTQYKPVLNVQQQVIGVRFIGQDFTASFAALRDVIKKTKVKDGGYLFALDNKGVAIAHPFDEGKNLSSSKDTDGNAFIPQMLQQGSGAIHYRWQEADGKIASKVTVFDTFKPWGMVIAATAYEDEVYAPATQAGWIILIALLLMAACLTALILVMVQKLVLDQLGAEPAEVAALAREIGEGHLDVVNRASGGLPVPEGSLMDSVQRMGQKLQRMIQSIHSVSHEVESLAHGISQRAAIQRKEASEQSDLASNIAASVEEMAVSVSLISDNASASNAQAQQSRVQAQEGGQMIQAAVTAMNSISGNIQGVSTEIDQLSTDSAAIQSIVTTITEIADQTNLLALNAAIEAARAGEQGRGFAVVADEVRKLAERTRVSTTEINDKITRLQNGTTHAVESIHHAVEQSQEGAKLASAAGTAIEQITVSTDTVLDNVSEISHALTEQRSVSTLLANQIEQVAREAESHAHAAGDSNQTAQALVGQIGQLRQALSVFRC
jgi:methyl-accepting chemotaxis protein-2 (aspartate sensor receptor)